MLKCIAIDFLPASILSPLYSSNNSYSMSSDIFKSESTLKIFHAGTSSLITTAKSLSIIGNFEYVFNLKSGKSQYDYVTTKSDFLSNLPDFELEELVISYLQIKENYYLLSNSIANKSTTVKIECELISRDISDPRKAVVQVKGGHSKEVDALDYMDYVSHNYLVYLFAPTIINIDKTKNVIEITKDDLNSFYKEYKSILPESIVRWENLFV